MSYRYVRAAILSPLSLSLFAVMLFTGVPSSLGADQSVDSLVQQLKAPEAEKRSAAAMELANLGEEAAPAVAALQAGLKDQDPMVRAHCARALGHIGKPAAMPAVEALALQLADPDIHARRAAMHALRMIKPGPDKVVPLMLKALGDKEPAVVLNALHTLAEVGEPAVAPMIEALKDDRTDYWACIVLSEIGPAAKDAVPQLIEKLNDDEQEVRMEVAMTLAAIGPAAEPAIPKLTEMLKDPESGVRLAAIYALGAMGPKAKSATAALEPGLKSKDLFTATLTTLALARIQEGDEAYQTKLKKEMLPTVFEAVKDKNRKVRIAAVQALNTLNPGPQVVIPAFARMIKTADAETISNVVEAVSTLGTKAVPGLINGLAVKEVRQQAAEALGRIGEPAAPAVPALIDAMDDERPEVRREVLFALGSIGPQAKPAVGAARKALSDADPSVRYSAVWALGRIGPDAAEALDELEKDVCNTDDPYFGSVCAWAMIRIDSKNEKRLKQALPVLIKALEHERGFVRSEAATTLGMIGPRAKDALPALKKAASDPDETVAKAAADAIAKITGQQAAAK